MRFGDRPADPTERDAQHWRCRQGCGHDSHEHLPMGDGLEDPPRAGGIPARGAATSARRSAVESVSEPLCPSCGQKIRTTASPSSQKTESKVGRALGISPREVRAIALELWGRSWVVERSVRSGGDYRRGRLGHISRTMQTEMREQIAAEERRRLDAEIEEGRHRREVLMRWAANRSAGKNVAIEIPSSLDRVIFHEVSR